MAQDEGRRGLWDRLRTALTGEEEEASEPSEPSNAMFTATRLPGPVAPMEDRLFPPAPGEDAWEPPPPPPPPPAGHQGFSVPPADVEPEEDDTLQLPRIRSGPEPAAEGGEEVDLRQLADELARYADVESEALSQLLHERSESPLAPTTAPPAPEAPSAPEPGLETGHAPDASDGDATPAAKLEFIAVHEDRVADPHPRERHAPAPAVQVHDETIEKPAARRELTPSEALALAERGSRAIGPRDDVTPAS